MRKRELLCRLSPSIHGLRGKQVEGTFKDKVAPSPSVSINQIVRFKKTALRRGVWYRALNLVERGILDLTARYVAVIKSAKLAKIVSAILEKQKLASEGVVDRLVRTVGFSSAEKVSRIAQSWGNRSAVSWGKDAGLARYLAVTHLNANGLN